MRVLVYGFSGKILGGIETFILNMNEHMSPNCVFDYIIDGDTCVYKERIERKGGRVFFVPCLRKNPLGYIIKYLKILKEQNSKGTSIIYIQLFSMANMLPAIFAKKIGYKVVLHAHNNGLQSKSKVYGLIHLAGKMLTKGVDYIRFTNSSLSSSFMFGEGVKSELIYNAIDTQQFSFNPEIRKAVREEQRTNNKVVIGFVGRFSPQKNPIFMLKIFAELVKKIENCELWIVGEGVMKDEMEAEVEKLGIVASIKWLGRRNDVNRLMMGMDLLLQPSIFEGLGIVLIEAQATGLPVVASEGVIPVEAAATPLIKFVNLEDSTITWANVCISHLKISNQGEREQIAKNFPKSFCISQEAPRLENLFKELRSGQTL